MNWGHIVGWLSAPEALTLVELVEKVGRERMIAVEVGSWQGRSTAAITPTIAKYNGSLYCVDHWLGSEKTPERETALTNDIYSYFKKNMKEVGIWEFICPMIMDSWKAAAIFKDGTADFIFIDADHRYNAILADIKLWLPKVRRGGILCGHDCDGRLNDPMINQIVKEFGGNLDFVVKDNVGCHPGVVMAVTEVFGEDYNLKSGIWYKEL